MTPLRSTLDCALTRLSATGAGTGPAGTLPTRRIATPAGPVRAYDSGTGKPAIVFVPDGPNVIEHYEPLIALLASTFRVVCFDMPGFGHSLPRASYVHSLDQGASVVLGVLDALGIGQATLAFSCANGFYALRAAALAPQRIASLILSQTPSLPAMHAWTGRVIPRPLKIPLLGQVAGWALRRKAASGWYRLALPEATDPAPFREKAMTALAHGGCFCLAGVVQGLLREQPASLAGVKAPLTIIWGSKDRSHKYTDPQSLRSIVPHAELVMFDDCGHFPDLEQAERFAALLRTRLAPLPSE